MQAMDATQSRKAAARLLTGFSAEVTTPDRKSIDAAIELMPHGSEVFVAALKSDDSQSQGEVARRLHDAGLVPVPHIVARNMKDLDALDHTLRMLTQKAGVERVLVLGGDRDKPAGELTDSLQIIQSGLLEKHGIKKIAIACYPEGHPRIPDETLDSIRSQKIEAATRTGLDVTLVSQFSFDARHIVNLARRMRAQGITVPCRVGIAGPASRAKLMKFALMCGVGSSLRAMKEREGMARNMFGGETPDALIADIANAAEADPSLGISGMHFFTFGSLAKTLEWLGTYSEGQAQSAQSASL